jgi:hypothetical protein
MRKLEMARLEMKDNERLGHPDGYSGFNRLDVVPSQTCDRGFFSAVLLYPEQQNVLRPPGRHASRRLSSDWFGDLPSYCWL